MPGRVFTAPCTNETSWQSGETPCGKSAAAMSVTSPPNNSSGASIVPVMLMLFVIRGSCPVIRVLFSVLRELQTIWDPCFSRITIHGSRSLNQRRKSGTGRKRPAPATGLLLALRGAGNQVVDGIGSRSVPAFGLRRAARRSRHRCGRIRNGLLRLADEDGTCRVRQIGIRLLITQADLRVPRRAQEIQAIRAPLPVLEHLTLGRRRQSVMTGQVGHFREVIRAAARSLPHF